MNLYSMHLREMLLASVSAILAIIAILVCLPMWPRPKHWVYDPTESVSFVLVSVLILFFLDVL